MTESIQLSGGRIDVQRIFCIGRNYAAHAAELGNEKPSEPVVFMKPSTAIVPAGKDVHLPRYRGSVHQEAELVLLIGRDGANGVRDIAGVALGLDLTLREEQTRLKAAGLPWELAKAFDESAPLGAFVPAPAGFDNLAFTCRVNDELRQQGNTRNMIFTVAYLVGFLAARFSLRRGDLVFTGTPEGVGPLVPGDDVELASQFTGRSAWHCR
ncbi:MAG: fumarylacetoacetate hydrolase family protein [Proteobacteria bacterium]|nr:fumarylacetoacetate hydrolase family protein [Pseudomonadota bacterium]